MPNFIFKQKSERFWFWTIIFWILWVSVEHFPLGRLSLLRISDVADAYLPVIMAKKYEISKYGFTFWSNFILSGTDNWAWCEEPFHFFDFLAFISPTWLWHSLMMFAQRFLAVYFTYRLCRERLKFTSAVSFFCAAAYSVTYWPQREFFYFYGFGMPGIAFFLWALGEVRNLANRSNFIISFILGALFAFTSYVPGGPIFFFPIMFLWGLFIDRYRDLRYWISFSLFALGSIFVDFPYLFAGILNLPDSTRATLDLRLPGTVGNLLGEGVWPNYFDLIWSFWKAYAIFILVPMAGLFWANSKSVRHALQTLLILTFFCAVISTLYLPLHSQLSSALQSLRGFGFYRFYLLAPFLIVTATGYGVTAILDHRATKRVAGFLLGILILLVVWQSIQIKINAYKTYANYGLLFDRSDLKRLKDSTKQDEPFRIATAFTEDRWLPHYALFYGFEIADGYLSVYSKRYHDFWGKIIEPLLLKDPKKNIYFHNWRNKAYLFSPTSKSPSFGSLALSIDYENPEVFSNYYNLNLLSLANVRFVFSRRPLQDANLKLISKEGDGGEWDGRSKWERLIGLWKGIYQGKTLYIYENSNVLPRLRLVGAVQSFDNELQLLSQLGKSSVQDLEKTALVISSHTGNEFPKSFRGSSKGSIEVHKYSPDFISLTVQAVDSTILVHSMSFNRYWKALIDGQPKDIFPVYHAFQGLVVPKGSHQVILEYCPPYRSCSGK